MSRNLILGVATLVMLCSSCGEVEPPKQKASTGGEPVVAEFAEEVDPDTIRVTGVGLSTPESVLYDAENDLYLVSNIDGSPADADGKAFISRIKPDGTVQELKWIDSAKDGTTLNAPKGMAIAADTLYVADIKSVRLFDRTSGAPKGEIKVKGATFLNGVAVSTDGTVYVADTGVKIGKDGFKPTGADAIYRLQGNKAVKMIKNKKLGGPNGLVVDGDHVWTVTFGSGALLKIDSKGKKVKEISLPKGRLDGIVKVDDALLISSWEAQAIYKVSVTDLEKAEQEPQFDILLSELNAPASIGFDTKRQRVLIPLFEDNALVLQTYTASQQP
jgi:hypothetical protein